MGAFLNGKDTACLHDNDSRILVLYGCFYSLIALLLKSTLRLFGMALGCFTRFLGTGLLCP